MQDKLFDIANLALPESSLHKEPLIQQFQNDDLRTFDDVAGNCGNPSMRGLWERQTDCIMDVRITDPDNKTQLNRNLDTILNSHEREKKKKYLKACIDCRQHFTPFVMTVDGALAKEAEAVLKKLAGMISEKQKKTYSVVVAHVRQCVSIALLRSTIHYIRGLRNHFRGCFFGQDGAAIQLCADDGVD